MSDGPTTFNGPLHTDEASLGGRQMTAYFANRAQAEATRDALVGNGVDPQGIMITDAAADAAGLKPADDTIIGKIREAVLPDDGSRATRNAIKENLVTLKVALGDADADRVATIIQAGHPSHFDADLERWRNSPPSA